jgi:two-component system response regulator YesN
MKVVVIDKDKIVRDKVCHILQKSAACYEFIGEAADGKAGLELVFRKRPDLVITDIHLPIMDGFSMVEKLLEEHIPCKVMILTRSQNFEDMSRAILYGVRSYLLKPVKVRELEREIHRIYQELEEEAKTSLIPDQLFFDALSGSLCLTQAAKEYVQMKYGILSDQKIGLFAVWLGKDYEEQKEKIKETLRFIGTYIFDTSVYLQEMVDSCIVVLIFCHIGNMERENQIYHFLQHRVVPDLTKISKNQAICIWETAASIEGIHEAFLNMKREMEWNLILGGGVLITKETIDSIYVSPMKYPLELEVQAKQAVIQRNRRKFMECFWKFQNECREEAHAPQEIKEVCIHYCWALLNTARDHGGLKRNFSALSIFQTVIDSFTWQEIENALQHFFERVVLYGREKQETGSSILIQRAIYIIEESYGSGITLGEVARQLCISQEYLSTRFRKETGKTFSEIIRACRMRHTRELLLRTKLNLGQIAEKAGYSDSKYMSKVFKQEMGMSPSEFRQLNQHM